MAPVSAVVVPRSSRPVIWGWANDGRGRLTSGVRLRLRRAPERPGVPAPAGPVVLVLPARDEGARIGAVIDRLPGDVLGHPTHCIVVDDGSADDTVEVASRTARSSSSTARAGASAPPCAPGSGRPVGLAGRPSWRSATPTASTTRPSWRALARTARSTGGADYVVGSRFSGSIGRMLPHRRLGNTPADAWRCASSPGDRSPTARAATAPCRRGRPPSASIAHDYNYAQVLTLDLLGPGLPLRRGADHVLVPRGWPVVRAPRALPAGGRAGGVAHRAASPATA